MAEIRDWWRRHRPTTRRLAQLYTALLYNANLKGYISGRLYTGGSKALCVPGLNCYSCPGAVGACPLGSLQNALAASGHTAGWYVFGILLLFGTALGRTVCGWLCPFGLLQELLHRIPTKKLRKSAVTRALSLLKYVVLALFVIALPLIYGLAYQLPLPAFCKYICPAGTLEGALGLLVSPENEGLFAQLGILFTRKFVILTVIGAACVFCYRSFCRFLCPLGAIYSLFNRFSLVGMRVEASRCNHCGACVQHCEMDVRRVGDRECISCGKCLAHCAQGAISLRGGNIVLLGPQTGGEAPQQPARRRRAGRTVWGVLLALLMLAVVYFNLIATPPADAASRPAAAGTAPAEDFHSNAPIGFAVGERLEDFRCELLDGSEFHLADYLGRVVIINQWATYCGPCVGEMPLLEQLQEEHPEIVVLAFHHWLETSPGAAEFVRSKGWDSWQIRFALDTPDQNLLDKIGGDNTMPRTVVLNRKGEVVYNEQRSVTADMLQAMLALADQ